MDKIVKGKVLDVNRLFNGVKELVRPCISGDTWDISDLSDVYLIICCVTLPFDHTNYSTAMNYAYIEFNSRPEFDCYVEIIAVPNHDCTEADFNEFFDTYSWFTIPFSDVCSRECFCKYLGLASTYRQMVGIILDPFQIVVQDTFCGESFASFGSAIYPFTDFRLKQLRKKSDAVIARFEKPDNNTLSLADVLGPRTDPSLKLKCLRGDDEISVLELSKKACVGLYLCSSQDMLPHLASVYKECKDNDLEFEMVIVCMGDAYTYSYLEEFEQNSAEFEVTSSWWRFPCHDSRTLWLSVVCQHYNYMANERLVIVRPVGKSWEMSAEKILINDGIISYPFTEEAVRERFTSLEVTSLLGGVSQTLAKLPCKDNNNNDNDDDDRKACIVGDLRDKNVLVYTYYPNNKKNNVAGRQYMKPLHDAFRAGTVPDLQVVLVPVGKFEISDLTFSGEETSTLWRMVLPPTATRVVDRAFIKMEWVYDISTAIIAFGKDGGIRSRRAHEYLGDPQKLRCLFDGDRISDEEAACLNEIAWSHMYGLYDDDEVRSADEFCESLAFKFHCHRLQRYC